MAEPYVGEIRMFAGNFAPAGWAFCAGQLLPISENETLFNLIGTTYGGDGEETFALPDLQSRIPIHMGTDPSGNSYVLGQEAGVEQVTLTTQQIPSHTHAPACQSSLGTQADPRNAVWAGSSLNQYSTAAPTSATSMSTQSLAYTGGSQPHSNLMQYLVVNFIISLFGVFPSES
jgi:microcystin-dependent protein